MSDAFLRVLNAPTGDDIAVARMWEQYDFDASEDGNMLCNRNNAPIVLTFCIDLEMVYTHNNTF